MAQTALAEVMEEGATLLPPAFRLGEIIDAIENIRAFNEKVQAAEREVAEWRDKTQDRFEAVHQALKDASVGLDQAEVARILLPLIDKLTMTVRDILIGSMSIPLFRNTQVASVLKRVRGNPQASGFLNTQIARADQVRKTYLAAYESFYYQTLALRAEYDLEAQPNGIVLNSDDDLDAYLDRLVGG